jgi:hypothetical protein
MQEMAITCMCASIHAFDEFLDYVILFLHIYVMRIVWIRADLSNPVVSTLPVAYNGTNQRMGAGKVAVHVDSGGGHQR